MVLWCIMCIRKQWECSITAEIMCIGSHQICSTMQTSKYPLWVMQSLLEQSMLCAVAFFPFLAVLQSFWPQLLWVQPSQTVECSIMFIAHYCRSHRTEFYGLPLSSFSSCIVQNWLRNSFKLYGMRAKPLVQDDAITMSVPTAGQEGISCFARWHTNTFKV